MQMTRRLKWNILAVCLAFLLSVAVYSWVTNYTDLATDIRGATWVDATIITDVVLFVDDTDLVVTTSKEIPDVSTLSMLFVYDAETVKRSSDDVASSYDIAVSEWDKWEATVIVTVEWEVLSKWEELVRMSVNWSPYDLIIADMIATFADWSVSSLTLTLP